MEAETSASLTICIPTYRRAELLKRCLTKLFSYLPDYVLVVVGNNASPDHTDDVVRPFLGRKNLTYFKNLENIGGDANLVKIISQVQTAFFMILTDDDYLDAAGLTKLLGYLRAYPGVGAIISPLHSVYDESEKVIHVRGNFSRVEIEPAGVRSVYRYADLAWTWSRLVLATDAVNLAYARTMCRNCYFMIILLGRICRTRNILVIPDRLVYHTIDNEVFWEYMASTTVDRRLFLDKNMLEVMVTIFDGDSWFERVYRRYRLYRIAAGYINGRDGLRAYLKDHDLKVSRLEFIARHFTEGEAEIKSPVFLYAFGLKLVDWMRVSIKVMIGARRI